MYAIAYIRKCRRSGTQEFRTKNFQTRLTVRKTAYIPKSEQAEEPMPNPFTNSAKKITDAQQKALSDDEFAKGMTAGPAGVKAQAPAKKTGLTKTASETVRTLKNVDNATKNAENIRRGKAAIAEKAGRRRAVDVADKLGKKAGIKKPVRDAATRPYRK